MPDTPETSEPTPLPPDPTASELIDRRLAASAADKIRRRETPTSQEREALKRWEKAEAVRVRQKAYRNCPQNEYCEMAGRNRATIAAQARMYGIPFGEKVIDMAAVIRGFHDLLSQHHHLFATGANRRPGDSQWLERRREIAAKRDELDYQERLGMLAEVNKLEPKLQRLADLFAAAGDKLFKRYGPEAAAIVNEAVDDFLKGMESEFRDQKFDVPPTQENGGTIPPAPPANDETIRGGGDSPPDRPV